MKEAEKAKEKFTEDVLKLKTGIRGQQFFLIQAIKEGDFNLATTFYHAIQISKEALAVIQADLDNVNQVLDQTSQTLAQIQGEIEDLESKLKSGVEDSGFNVVGGGSLLAGFKHVFKNRVTLGGEASFDFTNSVLTGRYGDDFKLKNQLGGFLLMKVGYLTTKTTEVYLSTGFGARGYNFSDGNNVNENRVVPYFLLGVGGEAMVTKRLGVFTELNFSRSVGQTTIVVKPDIASDFTLKSSEFKMGVRYYFL